MDRVSRFKVVGRVSLALEVDVYDRMVDQVCTDTRKVLGNGDAVLFQLRCWSNTGQEQDLKGKF